MALEQVENLQRLIVKLEGLSNSNHFEESHKQTLIEEIIYEYEKKGLSETEQESIEIEDIYLVQETRKEKGLKEVLNHLKEKVSLLKKISEKISVVGASPTIKENLFKDLKKGSFLYSFLVDNDFIEEKDAEKIVSKSKIEFFILTKKVESIIEDSNTIEEAEWKLLVSIYEKINQNKLEKIKKYKEIDEIISDINEDILAGEDCSGELKIFEEKKLSILKELEKIYELKKEEAITLNLLLSLIEKKGKEYSKSIADDLQKVLGSKKESKAQKSTKGPKI